MCRRSLIYAPFLMKWFTPPSWWMQTQITALFWNAKKNSYLWLNPPVERFGTLKWFECELAPWPPWPFVSTVGSGNPDLRVQKSRSLIYWVKRKQRLLQKLKKRAKGTRWCLWRRRGWTWGQRRIVWAPPCSGWGRPTPGRAREPPEFVHCCWSGAETQRYKEPMIDM